jgi:hypothetical protein
VASVLIAVWDLRAQSFQIREAAEEKSSHDPPFEDANVSVSVDAEAELSDSAPLQHMLANSRSVSLSADDAALDRIEGESDSSADASSSFSSDFDIDKEQSQFSLPSSSAPLDPYPALVDVLGKICC